MQAVPSMAQYARLLDSVPPERVNVPVMMHAMLEQVRMPTANRHACAARGGYEHF